MLESVAADGRVPGAAPATGDRCIDRRLSRRHRVSESRVFREAFDAGSPVVGRCMVMWLRRGEGAALRLGVIASRRTFRRSVDRSRAKRLLREAYRLNRFGFSGAVDVILVARRVLLTADIRQVEKDLRRLAAKAGLMVSGSNAGARDGGGR